MLDHSDLDVRIDSNNLLDFSNDLPRVDPIETRRIEAETLRTWLTKRIPEELSDRDVKTIYAFRGLEIVGDLEIEKLAFFPSVIFEKCRFDRSFTLSEVGLVGNLRFRECHIVRRLTFAESQCLEIEVKNVCTGAILLSKMKADKASINQFENALKIDNDSNIESLTIEPNEECKNVSIDHLTSQKVGIYVGQATHSVKYDVNDCTIADELFFISRQECHEQSGDPSIEISSSKIGKLSARRIKASSFSLWKTAVDATIAFSSSEFDKLGIRSRTTCEILDLNNVRCPELSMSDVTVNGLFQSYELQTGLDKEQEKERENETDKAGNKRIFGLSVTRCDFGAADWSRNKSRSSCRLSNCRIARDMQAIECEGPNLTFHNLTIDGDVLFYACKFDSLSLEQTRGRTLTFRQQSARIAEESLNLAGSQFSRIVFDIYQQDDPSACLPPAINFSGTTYDSLPLIAGPYSRRDDQYFEFLLRLAEGEREPRKHNPQPFSQLASKARAVGQLSFANRVQYEEREQARRQAYENGDLPRFVGLSLLCWLIGYGIGYGYFRAIYPVLILTLVGVGFLWPVPISDNPLISFGWKFGASLEQVLPLVKLSPHYTDFFQEKEKAYNLIWWQNAWFVVQRFLGWILATFMAAGLAGLTQKPS